MRPGLDVSWPWRIALATLSACGTIAEAPRSATHDVGVGAGGEGGSAGRDVGTSGGAGSETGAGGVGGTAGSTGGSGSGGSGDAGSGGHAGSMTGSGGAGGDGSSVDSGVVGPGPDAGGALDLEDVVCRLAGSRPINATTTLQHRNTDAERQIVRAYLSSTLTSFGLAPQVQDYGTGSNVYAELASTDGGAAWVVLGAHYDSVASSPGADDNASGVAMVVGIAEQVTRLARRSKNVMFALFDQEESGLVGSGKFADWLKERGLAVHSVHDFDQVGWDQDKDRVIELERVPDDLFALYQKAHDDGGFMMPLVRAQASGSDHDSFRNRAMPSLNISEEYQNGDTTPYHHKPSDTCETLDYAYMASMRAFMTYLMTSLLK